MLDKYGRTVVSKLKYDGVNPDYIEDWVRLYEATGLDLRDLADGMDVDAFIDAYEDGDLDGMCDIAL